MKIVDFRIIGTGEDFFVGGYEAMPSFMDRYKQLYDFKRLCTLPVDDFVDQMKKSGVSMAVLQAEYSYGDVDLLNRRVGETVKRHPDTLIGFAGIDPLATDDPVADLDRYVNEWDMKGLNLQPWVQGVYCNDKRLYPLYSYCQQKNIPVTIHASINFSVTKKIDYSHPLYLEEVACDFPKLTIVANHAGWPWVNEMVAVAWKHTNVFLEMGGVSPKYLVMPGTGWELFLTYGNSVLQDQILFATDSIIPHKRIVQELDLLPLKDTVKEKLLYKNALRVLKISSL
ncbi:MAG TPA: amidohydrolase family protein [Alphaproteobacteria bacterium]|mgnify:CR=1 FL=1|nr:amidohydrolase family protein [Alphaproteobacteria bacterium]